MWPHYSEKTIFLGAFIPCFAKPFFRYKKNGRIQNENRSPGHGNRVQSVARHPPSRFALPRMNSIPFASAFVAPALQERYLTSTIKSLPSFLCSSCVCFGFLMAHAAFAKTFSMNARMQKGANMALQLNLFRKNTSRDSAVSIFKSKGQGEIDSVVEREIHGEWGLVFNYFIRCCISLSANDLLGAHDHAK